MYGVAWHGMAWHGMAWHVCMYVCIVFSSEVSLLRVLEGSLAECASCPSCRCRLVAVGLLIKEVDLDYGVIIRSFLFTLLWLAGCQGLVSMLRHLWRRAWSWLG